MIAARTPVPSMEDFRQLMQRTDAFLNQDAQAREDYYAHRNGSLLEEDVYAALCRCAQGTPFEGSIALVSGSTFPDIVAHGYYGVEVKTTAKNAWTSIGSSILESTRHRGVERIFLTFGKLGRPVQFLSRPYEECLSGISVTHYPRYQIDMNLAPGQTIFDKMGVPYDQLRRMDNPVAPVSRYYRSQLGPGESLWWAADATEDEQASPPILRLWTALSPQEKNAYTVLGYALFPEILDLHSTTKYQRYALWLATRCSVLNTNIRDQFSAGGKVDIVLPGQVFERVPAAFGRIQHNRDLIRETILDAKEATLQECWQVEQVEQHRLAQWIRLVVGLYRSPALRGLVGRMLKGIFEEG